MVCSSLDCLPEKLQQTVTSIEDALVVLLWGKIPNGVREVRKLKIRRKRVERGLGVAEGHRNQRLTAAAEAMC